MLSDVSRCHLKFPDTLADLLSNWNVIEIQIDVQKRSNNGGFDENLKNHRCYACSLDGARVSEHQRSH